MSSNNELYTVSSWLKMAGLVTEAQKELVTEEEDEGEEELDLDTDEEPEEDTDAADDEADPDEEEAEADEENSEKDEDKAALNVVPSDAVTFDTELDSFFTDFEGEALTQVEALSLSKVLLEKEVRFDVVKFTDDVARLISNFTSLVDYEKIIVDKAERFLADKHDEEVAQIFIDMLADRHDISLTADESEPEVYAMGAVGGGE
jgi:hypothetical protein